jgi:dynein heavy chain
MLAGRSRRRATGEDIVSALARRLTGELRPFESVMELAGRVTADDAAAAAAAAAAGKQPAEAVCEEEEEVVEEKQEQKQAQAGQAEAAAKAPPSSTEPAQKQEQGSSGATLEEEEEPAPPPPLTDAALQARLSGLLESTTLAVHGYVRRGLFERDKLPALALLTFAVLCREGRLAGADAELELLLRGSVAAASSASAGAAGRGGAGAASAGMPAEEEQEDDDCDDEDEDEDEEEDGEGEGGNGSSSAQLGAAAALATALPGAFGGLPAEIERAPDAWRAWCRSPAAELSPVPQSAWAARLGIAGLTAAASAATAAPTTATTTTKQPPPPSLHSLLRHLLLIKALRPDRVTEAIARFCDRAMGPAYGGGTAAAAAAGPSPPSGDAASSSSLDDVVRDDASAAAPVFFVLFPGYSPAREVEALAARMGRTAANGHFAAVSMGQGQEPVAEQALRKAMRTGGWVFLDNLHLMQAWLPRLERLLEEGPGGGGGGGGSAAAANASASSSSSSSAQVHPGFRCLFSAEPIAGAPHAPILPEALVQSAVKVANEPPSDLRSNLRRAVASLDVAAAERRLSACHPAAPAAYRALAFGLCFFHGVLLGRKKFGVGIGGPGGGSGLGFCRAYAFNAGDLQSCADALVNSLAAAGDRAMAAAAAAAAGGGGNTTTTAPPLSIGWEDLRYSFGEIFYGGHVVDGMDRRTLSTYLRVLFREETLLPTGAPLDAADPASVWRPPAEELAPGLRAPIPLDAQAMARHVEERLPAESPAMYGLHPNAELSLLTALGEDLFRSLGDALGSVVAVSAGGGGGGGGGGAGGAAAAAAAAAPSSSSSSSSSDAAARRTLADLLARLPQELPLPDLEARAAAAGRSDAPLVVALLQETGRLNALLREMRRSMEELQLGLDGALNVTEAMDALQRALATGAVPALWMSAMSTRVQEVLGFAAWYSDVARRHDQLSRWASGAGPGACWGPGEDGDNRMEEQGAEEDGDGAAAAAAACRDPVVDAWARGLRCTWLGGLFNPKAFLAAVVQRRARALRVPLDEMAYVTEVMAPVAVGEAAAAPVAVAAPTTPADGAPVAAPAADTPATTTTAATPSLLPPPRDGGAYIVGLVLEAAGWHPGRGGSGDGSATTHGCLCDSKPGRMRAPLPPVLVRPVLAAEAARRASDPRCYLCPVYANGQRANVYSPAVATFTLPAAPDRREGRQQQQDQAGGRARAAPRDRWVLAGAALLLQDEGQQQQQQQQQQE